MRAQEQSPAVAGEVYTEKGQGRARKGRDRDSKNEEVPMGR